MPKMQPSAPFFWTGSYLAAFLEHFEGNPGGFLGGTTLCQRLREIDEFFTNLRQP